jgi:hypothetical protein
MPGNKAISGNKLTGELSARLPRRWRVRPARLPDRGGADGGIDLLLEVRAPDGTTSLFAVELKRQLDPVDVPQVVAQLERYVADLRRAGIYGVVASGYLSPRTRARLTEAGVGYLDLSGNCRIAVDRPGLFIETVGASHGPEPSPSKRTLRGAKAGRIVRMLTVYRPPVGVRQLAARADTDPGYTSRVVELLRREGLLERDGKRGAGVSVDWQGMIRRLSQDYALLESNRVRSFFAARGTAAVLRALESARFEYLLTGSAAASRIAPLAPARLVTCYVEDFERAAKQLDLREADTAANVILIEPSDPKLFAHSYDNRGLRLAALSQIVADLLTGPGRAPQEAEELMRWMSAHEDEWRT